MTEKGIFLTDKAVEILRDFMDAFAEASDKNRMFRADRLFAALDVTLGNARELEVEDIK